jgi:uncharacterized protein
VKIRLDSARYEPFRWQETVAVPASDVDLPGVEAVAPVEVDGTLSFAEPNFWLEMRLATVAAVTCDRCLRQFELPLAETVQWMVQQRSARPEPVERELGRDELGLIEVSGDSFESAPLVREQIVLALPAKPLCREDCAGLCPVCGGDRNLGECGCREPATDPRWAALSALRDKLDGRT